MYNISMDNFLKIINNVNIIDVRNKEKYNNNHMPNARNIMSNELITNPNRYMNRFDNYYIYCQKGEKSIRIVQILRRLGYKVYNINGGYEEWILKS